MDADILQRLAEDSSGYSKRQRAIAKYIIENSEAVSFMTASMLSQAAQVSESSIVRFSRQLGYSGYSQLRRALQQLLKEKLSSVNEAAAEPDELMQTVEAGKLSLKSIMTVQNQRALEAAVELLARAKKIIVQSGLGMEGVDGYFASNLRALGLNACSAPCGISREIFELDEMKALLC